ncbi:hypothetical protein BIV57_10880 [Mangrovactinospora gilvigrisea]|uniref:Uncharacterized protein n=1 Tax=Mangrovactinospora gilvigrisea TaxID=1428644 RepID=A0A1J7BVF7_9ACTN|nr:hypothetical protein [Mangrovactinospora gilvigrisea]OIV37465.1 hypothetical protein BIV57_10880 [Mangrovactinospora gilvigrisea]
MTAVFDNRCSYCPGRGPLVIVGWVEAASGPGYPVRACRACRRTGKVKADQGLTLVNSARPAAAGSARPGAHP